MSPSVPIGPEAAPTSVASASSIPISQSYRAPSLSPAGTASIIIFLSLLALAVIGVFTFVYSNDQMYLRSICDEGVAFFYIRRWRRAPKVRDEPPKLEKAAVHDIEALATNHLIVPVTPSSGIRWAPQIRSISGPVSDTDSNIKFAALGAKRARSPPPDNFRQSRHLHPMHYPRSAPPHAGSFSQNESLFSTKSSEGEFSLPVSPQALASGMETRSLGKLGQGPKSMYGDL
ncbi:hypothetical protein JVU11DRAFT_855 [Chiua virens]|nr:hypothetical protein JVU11DRAFT_855 [Chiua virens]